MTNIPAFLDRSNPETQARLAEATEKAAVKAPEVTEVEVAPVTPPASVDATLEVSIAPVKRGRGRPPGVKNGEGQTVAKKAAGGPVGRPAKYPWYTAEVDESFTVDSPVISIPPKAYDDGRVWKVGKEAGKIVVTRLA